MELERNQEGVAEFEGSALGGSGGELAFAEKEDEAAAGGLYIIGEDGSGHLDDPVYESELLDSALETQEGDFLEDGSDVHGVVGIELLHLTNKLI